MKNVFKPSLILSFLVLLLTSCLKHDLPEYPVWEENEIERVYVEYRFESSKEYNDEAVVAYTTLEVAQEIDEDSATVHIVVTVPEAEGELSEKERDKVSIDNLWVYMDISTAAKIEPLKNTPSLGDPASLKEQLYYRVTAANGDTKDWTIITDDFIK